jgi:hypothetical protein
MISIHATQSGAELEATRLELEHAESGSDRELDWQIASVRLQS